MSTSTFICICSSEGRAFSASMALMAVNGSKRADGMIMNEP